LSLIELLNLIEDIHRQRFVSNNREPYKVLGALEDLFPMKKREHSFIDINEAKKRSLESEHYTKVLPAITNKWLKSHLGNGKQIAVDRKCSRK
jgi:hypothetical protein